ncbi:MAG: T9SS type A sorting domain-containing protein [Rudanella sp.]|nr:T9SS type A sorting domain-containing protein [Rudanella sp.]
MSQPEVGLWVSPNPTSGKVVARFTLNEGQGATLSVVNLSGQSLQTQPVVGTGKVQDETLDLSQQASGLYVVRLQTAVGAKTAKVILQR